jgi:hypothetical protein
MVGPSPAGRLGPAGPDSSRTNSPGWVWLGRACWSAGGWSSWWIDPTRAGAGSGFARVGSLARLGLASVGLVLGLAPPRAGLQKLNTTRKKNNNEHLRVTMRDSALKVLDRNEVVEFLNGKIEFCSSILNSSDRLLSMKRKNGSLNT